MRPVTIVYVTDMEASLTFYRMLLPHAELVSQSPYWSELAFDGASIALHITDDVERGTQLGLALSADSPLEEIENRLRSRGITLDRGIADEAFGRSMMIRDLDGLAIQINEHDSERYPAAAG